MMQVGQSKVIAVFGSSRREENSALYQEAYELGRLLARERYSVLCGGYGGSMAAVSHGACDAGGHVVGVTCAQFDPLAPNRWLDREIKAPTLIARLETMMAMADGFIAVQGGIGTLAEVTLAWSLLQTRSLTDKALVLLGSSWPPILDTLCSHSDLGASIASIAQLVRTPQEAVDALVAPPTPFGPPPLG